MIEASWTLFIITALVLIAMPGQDMILVMSRSIVQGPRTGVATAPDQRCSPGRPRCQARARAAFVTSAAIRCVW